MNTRYDAKTIKEQVSLVALLAALGFKPAKHTGREYLYLSPLRTSDAKPSFSVNDSLGCWYDHGTGKGGNVVDFGMQYWPQLPFNEVLQKIVETAAAQISIEPANASKRKRLAVKEPHYQVMEIKELGLNQAISQYLQSRGVWQSAQGMLKEIYYYVEDRQKNRKHFFAAGWQNELGAWEVRNVYFKGCIGHKAISFIPRDPERLCVFEGFINYLSWQTDDPFCNDSILVLNSLALLQAGISKARQFKHISAYFDNDVSGRSATEAFRFALPQTNDCSWVYEGYNDYNDKIIADALKRTYGR